MTRNAEQTEYRNAVFAMMRQDGFSVRTSMREAVAAVRNKFETTADDIRSSLNVASRACYMSGATAKQINYIVQLANERGELSSLSSITTLSKGEASNIINHMKA